MKGKTILIINGKDRGKYAKVTKVLDDGNLSVRLENGVKTIINRNGFLEL